MSQLTNEHVPWSQEAEQAVLGSVLYNPEALTAVAAIVDAEDYYLLRHQHIWRACMRAYEAHGTVDLLLVQQQLKAADMLGDVGGAAYLMELTNSVPTSMHAGVYAEIVAQSAARRQLIAAMQQAIPRLTDTRKDFEEAMGEAMALVEGARAKAARRRTGEMIEHVMSRIYDVYEARLNLRESAYGVPTGFRDVDWLIGGLQHGELTVIAARPRMGKSALLVQMADHISRNTEYGVAVFLNEMNRTNTVWRMLGQRTGLNTNAIRRPHTITSPRQHKHLSEAFFSYIGQKMYINDNPKAGVSDFRAELALLQRLWGDKLVMFYDGMYRGEPERPYRSMRERFSLVSEELKTLATELNIPLVTAHQLNREPDQRADHRPVLSDLAETGNIERDADVIAFIYREVIYDANTASPNHAEIIVAKNREGPDGAVRLRFEPTTVSFHDNRPKE